MRLQTSIHLWLQPGDEKTLVQNVATGRQALLSAPELETLEQYCQGKDGCQSPLEIRLMEADLLVSPEEPAGIGPRGSAVLAAMDKFLAQELGFSQKKLQRTYPELVVRIPLAEEAALAQARSKSKSGTEEHVRDLKALFDHLRTHLEQDCQSADGYHYKPGFLSATAGRPLPLDEFAQLPCMPATTQRRALLAGADKERCLVLGDDDLVSLFWSQQMDSPCDVLELDPALLDFLRPRLRDEVELHCRDLTEGLPPEFHHRYDAIFTDPMYTREGWDLFLLCCRQGLAPSPEARVYLTTRPDLIEGGEQILERLARLGFEVEWREANFSRYSIPLATRRKAFASLRPSGVSPQLLQGLLQIPYLYSEMLCLKVDFATV